MGKVEIIIHDIRSLHRGEYLPGDRCSDTLSLILSLEDGVVRGNLWNAFFSALMTRQCDALQITGLLGAIIEYDPTFIGEKIKLGDYQLYDIRGSGKEDIKTFNVSTVASIIVASCGVKIIKSGSKSISATSGAVDIMNYIGITPHSSTEQVKGSLDRIGFAFVDISHTFPKYASIYDGSFYYFHPLSYILPALASPYKIDGILYGIAHPNTYLSAKLIADFGPPNAAVVSGSSYFEEGFIDEVSVLGKTRCSWLADGKIDTFFIEPGNFGIKYGDKVDIMQGRTVEESSRIFVQTLSGTSNRSATDMVCINAATLLKLAKKVTTWEDGYLLAYNEIASKRPIKLLEELVAFCGGDVATIKRLSA